MKTIRFYTKGRYMGFEKFNPKNVLSYMNWIRSGNDLRMDDLFINCPNWIREYCKNV